MFEEKVTDIVGLYLDPPDRAVVLSVNEKSQIQALDRTQPGLPLKKGRAASITQGYKRHGKTTLFAALDVKSGKVIGELHAAPPAPILYQTGNTSVLHLTQVSQSASVPFERRVERSLCAESELCKVWLIFRQRPFVRCAAKAG